jgi:hypothetical protein
MIIAVNPDFYNVDFMAINALEHIQDLKFHLQNLLGISPDFVGKSFYAPPKIFERASHQRLQARIQGALVVKRIWFWSEIRILLV